MPFFVNRCFRRSSEWWAVIMAVMVTKTAVATTVSMTATIVARVRWTDTQSLLIRSLVGVIAAVALL